MLQCSSDESAVGCLPAIRWQWVHAQERAPVSRHHKFLTVHTWTKPSSQIQGLDAFLSDISASQNSRNTIIMQPAPTDIRLTHIKCSNCGQRQHWNSPGSTTCTLCRRAYYCSEDCKRVHASAHEFDCRLLASRPRVPAGGGRRQWRRPMHASFRHADMPGSGA